MVVLPYDAEYGPTEKTSAFTSGNDFEIDVTRIKDELEKQKTCPLQISNTSLYFSPRGEAKCVRGPSGRGARRLARAGVLDSTLSTASKRNEVLALVSCASTVGW